MLKRTTIVLWCTIKIVKSAFHLRTVRSLCLQRKSVWIWNKPQKIYPEKRNPLIFDSKIDQESRWTKKLSELSKADQLCHSSYLWWLVVPISEQNERVS